MKDLLLHTLVFRCSLNSISTSYYTNEPRLLKPLLMIKLKVSVYQGEEKHASSTLFAIITLASGFV